MNEDFEDVKSLKQSLATEAIELADNSEVR